ncbi:MAG: hypothetical protein WCV71_03355 [Patescibacteria group bacterium]|jgi:hypothetical protein
MRITIHPTLTARRRKNTEQATQKATATKKAARKKNAKKATSSEAIV